MARTILLRKSQKGHSLSEFDGKILPWVMRLFGFLAAAVVPAAAVPSSALAPDLALETQLSSLKAEVRAAPAGDGYPSPALAWAMVAVLFIAYIFSFIDRMIIGLLIEPLKADLGLTDTQVSLLQGFAFAIFYTR